MKKRISIILAVILMAFLLTRIISTSALSDPALTNEATATIQPTLSCEDRVMALELFNKVNEYRISIGVAPLIWDEKLYPVAKTRANEISIIWSHLRPNGTYPDTAFKENGIKYKIASENLLRYVTCVDDSFATWYNSSAHRKTMENAALNKSAIYVYRAPNGYIYVAQEFTN